MRKEKRVLFYKIMEIISFDSNSEFMCAYVNQWHFEIHNKFRNFETIY